MDNFKKSATGIAALFLIIAISGTFVVWSLPTITSECGIPACHGTYTMTISSNATETVNVVVGGSFSLVIDAESHASSPTEGDMAVVVRNGWANNSEFSFIEGVILDNGDGDSNEVLGEITTLFYFSPQTEGNLTLRIWTAGVGAISKSLDVLVSAIIDNTSPIIDHPLDITIPEGNPACNITWTSSEESPSGFEIFDNGVSWVLEHYWEGAPIVLTLNNLTLGVHNITIVVWDMGGNHASDQVNVTVFDGTPPTIDNPVDLDIEEGTTGNTISWNASDLHPVRYEIFRNGTLVKLGQWNSSTELISISVDGLSLGFYNFTILVTDIGNNQMSDRVDVIVRTPETQTGTVFQLPLEIVLAGALIIIGLCVVGIAVFRRR